MKKFALLAAAAALTAGPAFAQTVPGGSLERAPSKPNSAQVPSYQRGDGQEAGGPAKELQPKGSPATTGTINGRIPAGSRERNPALLENPEVPAYQRGDGQESGGPAKELRR